MRIHSLGWAGVLPALTLAAAIRAGEPSATAYDTRTVAGWNVKIDRALLESDRKRIDQALVLLERQLRQIDQVVPRPAVQELRKVTLWFSPEYPGIIPRAEYHPNAAWLREHHRNPAMAKGVEFTNVRIFAAECRRMPVFVLHELAHAYHDRVLGFENAQIKAVYEKAKSSGKYDRVERKDSEGRKSQDRAYALSSPQEFFAEASEAYFGVNDFEPYTRKDLEAFDPGVASLLARLWERAPGQK